MAEQKYFFRLLLVCEPISTGFCRFPIPELFRAKVAVVLLAFCDDFAEGRAVLLLGAVRSFRGPLAVILRSFCARFAVGFSVQIRVDEADFGRFWGTKQRFRISELFRVKVAVNLLAFCGQVAFELLGDVRSFWGVGAVSVR